MDDLKRFGELKYFFHTHDIDLTKHKPSDKEEKESRRILNNWITKLSDSLYTNTDHKLKFVQFGKVSNTRNDRWI